MSYDGDGVYGVLNLLWVLSEFLVLLVFFGNLLSLMFCLRGQFPWFQD